MNKEKFIEMLNNAKEDEYGRLYVIGDYHNKIYFGTITTICEDIFKGDKSAEIYDRHFWNDDTLECYVVSTKHNEETKYTSPKRIEKLGKIEDNDGYINQIDVIKIGKKVDEIIDVLNKYECLTEKLDDDE